MTRYGRIAQEEDPEAAPEQSAKPHSRRHPQLGACPQCHRLKPTHRVCPFCGTYNGHHVLEVKETARPL
jgi:ribosomal protein L32